MCVCVCVALFCAGTLQAVMVPALCECWIHSFVRMCSLEYWALCEGVCMDFVAARLVKGNWETKGSDDDIYLKHLQ